MAKKSSGGLKLQFLGATGTVTGSKFYLHNASGKFLIDCGLFQGFKELRLRNWAPLPVAVVDINAVVLTHAHIDHSGYFPVLVKQGFRGRGYASSPTVELCKILLPDSGFLQEEDAAFAMKKGFSKHLPALPLYTYSDAMAALPYLATIPNGKPFDLGHGLTVKLIQAGHILGARFVHVTSKLPHQRTVLFAGDIGARQKHPAAGQVLLHKAGNYAFAGVFLRNKVSANALGFNGCGSGWADSPDSDIVQMAGI